MSPKVEAYAATLRRIPKPIRLAMATREFIMNAAQACVCGWAIRESLAFANGHAADYYQTYNAPSVPSGGDHGHTVGACVAMFGGTHNEWADVFYGVMDGHERRSIEAAFVTVLLEAVPDA